MTSSISNCGLEQPVVHEAASLSRAVGVKRLYAMWQTAQTLLDSGRKLMGVASSCGMVFKVSPECRQGRGCEALLLHEEGAGAAGL